jgi:uncharacterized protein (TIGR00251 family)
MTHLSVPSNSSQAVTVIEGPNGVRLDIRVIPRAPQAAIGGVRDGRLIVRVSAPPVDGAANGAVVAAVAEAFHVPPRSVSIVSGHKGRNKTIQIAGLAAAAVRDRLQPLVRG